MSDEFARLEKKYGRMTANLGPMSRGSWVAYWKALEALEPPADSRSATEEMRGSRFGGIYIDAGDPTTWPTWLRNDREEPRTIVEDALARYGDGWMRCRRRTREAGEAMNLALQQNATATRRLGFLAGWRWIPFEQIPPFDDAFYALMVTERERALTAFPCVVTGVTEP